MPALTPMMGIAMWSSALALAYPVPLGQSIEPGGSAPVTSEVLDIEEDRASRMTVPVSIEGKGPFSFVIDTGAERTVLSRKLATNLNLEAEEPAQLLSIAGSRTVDMVYVPSLTLGTKSYGGLISPVLRATDIGADGILGLDGLQNHRILFDFLDNQITVEDAAEKHRYVSTREIVVAAKRRSGQMIFTDATVGGVPVNVIVDTGAEVSIANPVLQRKLIQRKKESGEDNLLIAVTGDKVGVEFGQARDFRIGRAQFDWVVVAFADAPPFEKFGMKKKPALLLGMDVLRQFDRVAIDFVERKIHFLPPKTANKHYEAPVASRLK